jgi:hypothetical protein
MIKEMIRLENVNLPPRVRQNRLDLSMGNARVCEEKLGGQVWRPAPLKVEFRKMLLPMPLLFLSGLFTGIGIMLALN